MRTGALTHAALAAALASSAAGCGALPLTVAGDGTLNLAEAEADADRKGPPALVRGIAATRVMGPGALVAFPGVELTAEQQAQMAEIAKKHMPPPPDPEAMRAETEGRMAAVAAALRAEPFDPAGLEAALVAHAPARRPIDIRAMMAEARAVLTPEQRQAAIAALRTKSWVAPAGAPALANGELVLRRKPGGEPHDGILAAAVPAPGKPAMAAGKLIAAPGFGVGGKHEPALGLTDEQRAELAKLLAPRQTELKRTAVAGEEAMIAFLETGDVSKLPEPPEPTAPAYGELAAFVAKLDASQRAALAERPGLLLKPFGLALVFKAR